MSSGFGSASHLARRFAGSLWPRGPKPADEAWARSYLTEGEEALWAEMAGPDRRHAVAVARRLVAAGQGNPGHHGDQGAKAAIPAALLHDVGKLECRFGPFRRAATTALAIAVGRDRLARGRGRMARYLRHDSLGAGLLERAGSEGLTVAWAREHHLPDDRWSVPQPLGAALKAADDD
ncbi:MAG: hypothetical protein M3083_05705 [Actinomycetota bacterium]|nr:hypothetical protein [Actinomycetota bacterium]